MDTHTTIRYKNVTNHKVTLSQVHTLGRVMHKGIGELISASYGSPESVRLNKGELITNLPLFLETTFKLSQCNKKPLAMLSVKQLKAVFDVLNKEAKSKELKHAA